IWLYCAHALAPFWSTVFVNGGSKGTLGTLLTRPFLQMPVMVSWGLVTAALIGLLLHRRSAATRPETLPPTLAAACAAALVLPASVWTARSPLAAELLKSFIPFHWFVIVLAFLGSGMLFIYLSWRLFHSSLSAGRRDRWFLAGLSFVIAYMLALSWPAYSPMVVPSLALAVAFAMDRLETSAPRGV